eukprot:gene7373-497_t
MVLYSASISMARRARLLNSLVGGTGEEVPQEAVLPSTPGEEGTAPAPTDPNVGLPGLDYTMSELPINSRPQPQLFISRTIPNGSESIANGGPSQGSSASPRSSEGSGGSSVSPTESSPVIMCNVSSQHQASQQQATSSDAAACSPQDDMDVSAPAPEQPSSVASMEVQESGQKEKRSSISPFSRKFWKAKLIKYKG